MNQRMSRWLRFAIVFTVLLPEICLGQVWINELDSDSPGVDTREFVELRTLAPFTSLNGYVLVFFNGNPTASNANQSYFALSLNGYTTDANGLLLIGNQGVSPVPDLLFSDNVIQNGEDGVAVYQGSLADWPVGTTASTVNLVHALTYDTSDPDAVALMALLGIVSPQVQMDENQNSLSATQSIQRKNDGTYEVKTPTPGAMNDGSGIVFNGVSINVNTAHRTEGDSLHIIFKTQTAVLSPLNFSFTLSNGGFNASDYTGNTLMTIPPGSDSVLAIISTVDDTADEGDEVLKISFNPLPAGYVRMNDKIEIRIVDNDYSVDPWGTPLQPTYGIVTPTIPTGYYASIHGKSGAALKLALQGIIADTAVVRSHCYGDIPEILSVADHNPKNGNQVWLMYVETPRAKLDYQTTASGTGKWNREHIYPQSRGGYSNGTSDIPDGYSVWLPTGPNDLMAGHADAHALRAEDAPENSSRNNRDYGGDYNGPAGTAGSWKGDVARAVFYMCVRYNGLQVVSGDPNDTTNFQLGDLDTLLAWHQMDPPDDFEMFRNNYIQTWQQNRNPFIDHPDLVEYVYGNMNGQPFYLNTAVTEIKRSDWLLYPNPSQGSLFFNGPTAEVVYRILSPTGVVLEQGKVGSGERLTIKLPGGYYWFVVQTKAGQEVIPFLME